MFFPIHLNFQVSFKISSFQHSEHLKMCIYRPYRMADLGKIVKEAIPNRFLDKSPAELAKTRHYGLGGTIYQGGEESHYFEFKEKKGLIIW